MPSNERERITLAKWKEWMEQKQASIMSHAVSFVGKKFKAFSSENPSFYIGVELEVDYFRISSLSKARDILFKYLGDFSFVFKHDGSIGGRRSVEMVTSPRSYMNWDDVELESMCQELRNLGFRSWDSGNCGFHLHFSRVEGQPQGSLIDRVIAKFFVDNEKILRTFSRRTKYEYCKFNNTIEGYTNGGRYLAVNFTNVHTIEFRFPRGTLNPSPLRAYIQVCNAIYELALEKVKANGTSSAVPSISWGEVQSWLMKRRKTTNEAREVLKSLNLWSLEANADVISELQHEEKIKVLTKLNSDLPKLNRILAKTKTRYAAACNAGRSNAVITKHSVRRDQATRLFEDTKVEITELRKKGVEQAYIKTLADEAIEECRDKVTGGNTDYALRAGHGVDRVFLGYLTPAMLKADTSGRSASYIVSAAMKECQKLYPQERVYSELKSNGVYYIYSTNEKMGAVPVRYISVLNEVKDLDGYLAKLQAESRAYTFQTITDESGNQVVWRFDNPIVTHLMRDSYGFISPTHTIRASSGHLISKYSSLLFNSRQYTKEALKTTTVDAAADLLSTYNTFKETHPGYEMFISARMTDYGYSAAQHAFHIIGNYKSVLTLEPDADGKECFKHLCGGPEKVESFDSIDLAVAAVNERIHQKVADSNARYHYHIELDVAALAESTFKYNVLEYKTKDIRHYIVINRENGGEYTDETKGGFNDSISKIITEVSTKAAAKRNDRPVTNRNSFRNRGEAAQIAFSAVDTLYSRLSYDRACQVVMDRYSSDRESTVYMIYDPNIGDYNVMRLPEIAENGERVFIREMISEAVYTDQFRCLEAVCRRNQDSDWRTIHGYIRVAAPENCFQIYRLIETEQIKEEAAQAEADALALKAVVEAENNDELLSPVELVLKEKIAKPLTIYFGNLSKIAGLKIGLNNADDASSVEGLYSNTLFRNVAASMVNPSANASVSYEVPSINAWGMSSGPIVCEDNDHDDDEDDYDDDDDYDDEDEYGDPDDEQA